LEQDNSNERLVTVTGNPTQNQMALFMLYNRLENEKHRI
jgi:heterogeneous nuclear rnp K-like protein